MSARDIIREIEALPPEERQVVRDYLLRSEPEQAVQMEEAVAAAAADRVFAEHAELFRKLAQ